MTDRPEVRREPLPIVTRKPRPGATARITITFAFDPSVFDDGGEDRSCPRTPEEMAWAIAAEVDSSDSTIGGGRLDMVSAAFEVTPCRQPVIIMRRGRRVNMEASVFPVVLDKDDGITTGVAMAHGTYAECVAWIDARAEHVEMYGRTEEVDSRFGNLGDQNRLIRHVVNGRPVPSRCLWRPPEERVAALAEARARVEQTRGQALVSMSALRSFADSAVETIGESARIDANRLDHLCWNAKSDTGRYVDAVDRLAKLTEE